MRWPGAEVETYTEIAPGRWVAREGVGLERATAPPELTTLRASAFRPAPSPGSRRVVLPSPLPLPKLPVTAPDGGQFELFGLSPDGASGTGTPMLLTLWASWCAPCVAELNGLSQKARELKAAGLAVLALNADEEEDLGAARALLERIGWPFPTARPSVEALDRLDALDDALLGVEDRLGVPTSWLVDAQGRLAVLYHGPVDPDTVLTDLALLELDAAERRDAAVPLAGRWHARPFELDLGFYEGRLKRRGLTSAAREFHLGQLTGNRVDASLVRYRMGAFARRAGTFSRGHRAPAGSGRKRSLLGGKRGRPWASCSSS